METPKYLRREGTDLIFVATDALLKRKDMKPYHGPVPFRQEGQAAMPVLDEVPEKAGFDVSVDEVTAAVNRLEG
jgi:hypothetical protein